MYLLAWIIIGLVVGWLTEEIVDAGIGLATSLFVGILGAILGGWLFALLDLDRALSLGSLISAFLGSVVLWAVVMRFTIEGKEGDE